MTAHDLVIGFITALGVCLRALASTTSEVSRADPHAPLTAVAFSGERSRHGVIAGVGSYQLHGIGCRFELESGEEVDFDWDQDGLATFDVWRVRKYARSLGEVSVAEAELTEALARLCKDGGLTGTAGGRFHVRVARR